MDWLALLTAFGLGSIVSALIQVLLTQRGQKESRDFEERKAAYIGFWESLMRQDLNYNEASLFDVGHWIVRCELVAPKSVREKLRHWSELGPRSSERPAATKALKHSMREDLNVSK
jgi:hypothetical protein